jgi:hypothetical protein
MLMELAISQIKTKFESLKSATKTQLIEIEFRESKTLNEWVLLIVSPLLTSHSLRLFSVIVILLFGHQFIARNLVALLDPRAQIDHLAALGAKRTVRIIFPRGLGTTGRTLDRQRHGFLVFGAA